MFGKMGDMMGKMREMKQKSDEIKKRLDTISVNGEAENGSVTVVCNGNQKITSVQIQPELLVSGNHEKVQELIMVASNHALEKAKKVNEAEMAEVAKGMLPGLG